jgi:hypothetical protein
VASFREGKIQTRKTNRVSMTGTCMSLSWMTTVPKLPKKAAVN